MVPELQGEDDYDWTEAFKYARKPDPAPPTSAVSTEPFCRELCKETLALRVGENDEESWIWCGLLHDGRWAFLEAGCDYTGWG